MNMRQASRPRPRMSRWNLRLFISLLDCFNDSSAFDNEAVVSAKSLLACCNFASDSFKLCSAFANFASDCCKLCSHCFKLIDNCPLLCSNCLNISDSLVNSCGVASAALHVDVDASAKQKQSKQANEIILERVHT